jgi:hypothetical protein
MKLTQAQRRKLEFLTDEWREEPEDWVSGALFGRLEVMGLCEMESRRLSGGDVLTGPGSWGRHAWFTRRTAAGRAALTDTSGDRNNG